jgi:hypothetical protein
VQSSVFKAPPAVRFDELVSENAVRCCAHVLRLALGQHGEAADRKSGREATSVNVSSPLRAVRNADLQSSELVPCTELVPDADILEEEFHETAGFFDSLPFGCT